MHNNKEVEVEVEDLCVHSATCLSLPACKNTLDTDSSSLNAFETYTNVQFHKVAIIVKQIQTYKRVVLNRVTQ